MFNQILNLLAVFAWQTVTCGVRYIYYCSSGLDDGFHYAGKIFIVGTPGVFRVKLDIFDILFCVFYGGYGTLDNFLTVAVELVFYVRIACSYTRMYAFVLCIFNLLRGYIYVFFHCSCQRTYGRPSYGFGYFYY